jgi:preprotein translocase subunit SecE
MSEQKKVEKKVEEQPCFFARTGQTVSKWFRDFKSECKKIVWPSRKHVINNTLVVIGFAIAVMILVYVLDVSFGFVRDTLVKLI